MKCRRSNCRVEVPEELLVRHETIGLVCKPGYCHKKDSHQCPLVEKELSEEHFSIEKKDSEGVEIEVVYSGNEAVLNAKGGTVNTLEDLLEHAEVDLDIWKVEKWHTSVHHQVAKLKQSDGTDELITTALPVVRCSLIRREAIATEYPVIHPVKIDTPIQKETRVKQSETDRVVVLIPDTQHGFRRRDDESLEPFHDTRALAIAHEIIKRVQPTDIIFLGDHLDFPEFSDKFLTPPNVQFLAQAAIDSFARYLWLIRDSCRDADIHWIEGNHEYRLEKHIINHNKGAYGLKKANCPDSFPVMSIPYLLQLDDIGVTYHGGYPYSQLWLNDYIRCEHGSTARSSPGATSLSNLKDNACSVIQGHIHNQEKLWSTSSNRDGLMFRAAISPGTLARVDAEGVPGSGKRSWQQSVEILHIPFSEESLFFTETVDIREGKAVFRGDYLEVSDEYAKAYL